MASFFGFGKKKNKNPTDIEEPKEETGVIGRFYENDFPVIVKFVKGMPDHLIQKNNPMLTVVSWKYEGGTNNGMPPAEVNQKINILEDALEKTMDRTKLYHHAYSRTGNNLKELVYYSSAQSQFMNILNETLSGHERYPIEINFFEDADWSELKKLIEAFNNKNLI